MNFFSQVDFDYLLILSTAYLFVSATVARFGSMREAGGKKTLLISLFLTPVSGLLYVLSSQPKDTLKITHYRCPECALEYTDGHHHCPSCKKEGKKVRLIKFSMRTY
jgi:hypothetical protein